LDKQIDIAVHIRNFERAGEFDRLFGHLDTYYSEASFCQGSVKENFSPHVSRIYIGDEFCTHRLPDLNTLQDSSSFAVVKGLELTLLTPPFTDREIERHTPLFQYLNEFHSGAEIVVNDMGVILFLKETFPALRLSAGRLLNKAFRDPRLTDSGDFSTHSAGAEKLLNECTFDNETFQRMITGFDIWRMEQDLPPYGTAAVSRITGMKSSVYFPFGYISSGRVCFPSTFNMPKTSWFMPLDKCSRSCELFALDLKNERFRFQLVQSGNTVFYLYPEQLLTELFEKAGQQEIRMVYQGFAI